jgi:M6 family metalloprotease-like protein
LTSAPPPAIRNAGIQAKGADLKSFRTVLVTSCALAVLFLLLTVAGTAAALEPPLPGELAKYRRDGSLSRRVAHARELGNDHIVPGMLQAAVQRLQRAELGTLLRTPPPAWRGMPTKGTVNVLAVPICFSEYPQYSSEADLQDKLFGDGDAADVPYESVHAYYERSSYGRLNVQGDVLPWFNAGARSAVGTSDAARENLIKKALNAYDDAQADRAWADKYDNDGDGVIDYLVVIWTGPHTGWAGFWWGYQTSFSDNAYRVGGAGSDDGLTLNVYSWQWEYQYATWEDPAERPYDPLVTIHETGHALGLPDYYDYEPGVGPEGGVGGLDMMDNNWGDHNVFSKWLLDWLTPLVVSDGYGPVTLSASATTADALVVMPGVSSADPFQEYFMVENKYRVGNNDVKALDREPLPADGLLIWHVDATLYAPDGYDYLYNNSYTSHKLLRLMEADGREEIAGNGWADEWDYYQAGDALGPTTRPSGYAYGKSKAIVVRDISAAGETMSLFASTDWRPPFTKVSGVPSGWTRRPVTLTFSATDADSDVAVAGTRYRVDDGPWTADSHVVLPADPATHDGDGVHVVAYRSTANAGNTEAPRKVTVRIDTAGPTCMAPRAAAARRGGIAKLTYSVADKLSPRVNVTIRVRRPDGAVVRTLKAAGVTTGVRHVKSFACTIPRGSYRFQVTATDLAGNRQTKMGWNTLRVR